MVRTAGGYGHMDDEGGRMKDRTRGGWAGGGGGGRAGGQEKNTRRSAYLSPACLTSTTFAFSYGKVCMGNAGVDDRRDAARFRLEQRGQRCGDGAFHTTPFSPQHIFSRAGATAAACKWRNAPLSGAPACWPASFFRRRCALVPGAAPSLLFSGATRTARRLFAFSAY